MIALRQKTDARQWLLFRRDNYFLQFDRLQRRRQTIGEELENTISNQGELMAGAGDLHQNAHGDRKAIFKLVEEEFNRLLGSPAVASVTMGEENSLVITTPVLQEIGDGALRLTVNVQTLVVSVEWAARPYFWSSFYFSGRKLHAIGSDPLIAHTVRFLLMGVRLDLLPDLIIGAVRNTGMGEEKQNPDALLKGVCQLRHRQILRDQGRPRRLPFRSLRSASNSLAGLIQEETRLCAELVKVEAGLVKLGGEKPFFEKVASEFELLHKLPLVESLDIEKNAYCIFTKKVQLMDEKDIKRDIGRFRITVNINNSAVSFCNLDKVINGYHHPHVTGRGGCQPCLGSLRSWLAKRFIVGEIGIEMAPQLLQFLTSWNKQDAYIPASAWPKARR